MPSLSARSQSRLDTASGYLQELFKKVIVRYDFTVIQGWRSRADQDAAFNAKCSKVGWPDSKHNKSPSEAVDVAPYLPGRGIPWPQTPTDWNDRGQRNSYIKDLAQFYHLAGYVEGVSASGDGPMRIRWGGDWDRDHNLSDQTFDDLVHFELIK
jgi:peptidoglycan L-alanyl-D-glutamate endopeptidase CwlK